MSYKTKRLVLILVVLFGMPMMCAANCDDDDNNVPDTNTDSFDEVAENTSDAVDEAGDTLNTMYCMDTRVKWEVRCGGDGVDPNAVVSNE